MNLNNRYYLLRHGEAESNVRHICSSWPETFENHLTEHGRGQIKAVAEKLSNKGIGIIFCSPLLRAQETAGIVAEVINIKPQAEDRLREIGFGIFNGKPVEEFRNYFDGHGKGVNLKVPKGESYLQVQGRIVDFFKEVNEEHRGKTILIVSHQAPLLLLQGYIIDNPIAESIEPLHNVFNEKRIAKGELIELPQTHAI